MTRIGFIGDSHFEEGPRFDECLRIHDWIADDMKARGVDFVVHTGDVADKAQNRRERNAIADWLCKVADDAPVLLIRGNHDAYLDLSIFSRLRTRHPVIVEETAGVHVINGVAIAALAWPQKANVLATLRRLNPGATKAEGDDAAALALRAVMAGLGDQLAAHEGPRLFAAHAMFRGSKTSLGQPLMGHDFEVGLEDLVGIPADFFALGHIHMGQEWDLGGRQAAYSGSPYATAYGETEPKGYIVAEFSASTFEGWQRVLTPRTPMELVEAWWDAVSGTFYVDAMPFSVDSVERGADVRFRYRVEADRQEAARRGADEIKARLIAERGAVAVTCDPKAVAESHARAPEVAAAVTLAEKLAVYWRVRGVEMPEERRGRLVSLAGDLQGEVRRAA